MITRTLMVASLTPVLLPGSALAQHPLRPGLATPRAEPITAPIRDAGVYHVATGTWSRRTESQASFGPDVLYNNDAPTGFYGLMSNPHTWTDSGRIPGAGSLGAYTDYVVDGFQTGYCTAQYPAPTSLIFAFYDLYPACTDPTLLEPVGGLACPDCPSGWGSTTACWIVTFDLRGSTHVFVLPGDGDGVFDGVPDLDTFGLSFHIEDVSGGNAGPILCGDPANYPMGDGTYYQNPGAVGTGLDTTDEFWLVDDTGSLAPGCYWYGGYVNGSPFGSIYWRLFGEGIAGRACTTYCNSTANSTGGPAELTTTDACDLDGDSRIELPAQPVPSEPGLFFSGTAYANRPFGNGRLCAAGTIVRGGVVHPSGNVATYGYDLSGLGGDRNIQYWFRDPGAGGASFNTSSAIDVQD